MVVSKPLNQKLLTRFLLFVIFLVNPILATAQYVPGEAIVKFVEGTEGSKTIAQVSQSSSSDLRPLTPTIQALQSKVGIPLQATQITSGQRVVLSVELDALINSIVEKLGARQNVALAQVLSSDLDQPRLFPLPKSIAVAFLPDSLESDLIAHHAENPSDSRFGKMVAKIERDIGIPLSVETSGENTILLRVDVQKLTMVLIERLQRLAEVESAQPNFISTFQ